jgi:hypothetical protein
MLAEMPREILDFLAKLKKFANAVISKVQAGISKLAG